MKMYYFALLGFLLLFGVSHSANITLSYSECKTVVLIDNSTDTICAPVNTSLNESATYKLAMNDCISKVDSISGKIDNSTTSIQNSASLINQNLTRMNQSFSELLIAIDKLGGINVTGDYASCLVRWNQSQIENSNLQRRFDNLTLVMQGMIPTADYNVLAGQKQDALDLADSRKDDLRNGVIIGVVIGIVIFWYWKKRNPSSDLDISGGRAPKIGNR